MDLATHAAWTFRSLRTTALCLVIAALGSFSMAVSAAGPLITFAPNSVLPQKLQAPLEQSLRAHCPRAVAVTGAIFIETKTTAQPAVPPSTVDTYTTSILMRTPVTQTMMQDFALLTFSSSLEAGMTPEVALLSAPIMLCQ